MEGINQIACPVCTLYLRPGMTLESHLTSHPKQRVIEALIRVTQLGPENVEKIANECPPPPASTSGVTMLPQMNMTNVNPSLNQMPANHSFIYQQFVSTSGTQPVMNMSPINQQYVAIPAVFNPQAQMVMPQYIFQQQQQVQVMSCGPTSNIQPCMPHVPNLPSHSPAICAQITVAQDPLLPSPNPAICASIQNHLNTNNLNIPSSKSNEIISISENSFKIQSNHDNLVDFNSRATSNIDLTKKEENSKDLSQETANITTEDNAEHVSENEADKDENELNKACQTTQIMSEKIEEKGEGKNEFLDSESHEELTNNMDKIVLIASEHEIFDQNQTLHLASNNDYEIIQKNDECVSSCEIQTDATVTVLEVDDMNFILPNDFIESEQIISTEMSKSAEMDISNDNRDQVLLTIEEEIANETLIVGTPEYEIDLNEKLEDCVNIRADEKMPARGELSEQESNGASEIGWESRIYQEGGSGMSTSYDLLARESWEASDCSDSEMPPLQSRIQPSMDYSADDPDEPDAEETDEKESPTPFEFKCSDCGKTFRCPKERRVHQTQEHASCSSSSPPKAGRKRITRVSISKSDDKLDIFKTEDVKTEDEDYEDTKTEVVDLTDSKDCLLCNTCGELLSSMRDLNIHNRKAHNIRLPNTNLTCKTCNEPFRKQREYIEHLKMHPLECVICGKQFYKPSNLKLHLKRHSGVRPYKCDICDKSFFARQKLREHTNIHTGNSPIKCTLCDEKFKRHSNLVQHRNYHHLKIKKKTRDYICFCGEICTSKSKLNWHKETHEAKPKSCTYCNEKFIHMASLTRHIRRAHNQHYVPDEHRKGENVECKICKGIYLKSSIEAHLNIHTGKRQYICTICNKEFTTKWNLKLHKWIHAAPTNKPFKCDICQSAYFRESDYISHMNSHRSVKPYTCNYCGCKFIRKYNCVRHVKEHEEKKSFNCEVCNKSFHRSYYLKEHMRVHTGARPFSCNICGKTSTTKSNHNKHMKIHHAREPVTTEG